ALEAVMQSREMTERQLETAAARTTAAIRRTLRLLPDIQATRFHRLSDFYSLTLLMAQFERARLVLSDRKRNRQAAELLRVFSARNNDGFSGTAATPRSARPRHAAARSAGTTSLPITSTRGRRAAARSWPTPQFIVTDATLQRATGAGHAFSVPGGQRKRRG